MSSATFKIAQFAEGGWREFRYDDQFCREPGPPERLVIGTSGSTVELGIRLMDALPGSYDVIVALHTERTSRELGRYRLSGQLKEDVSSLLRRFEAFIESDARLDVWILGSDGAIQLDKHALVFAYGPMDEFESALVSIGLSRGAVDLPFPHAHQYNESFDADEAALFDGYPWTRTPLEPGDGD